VPTIHSPNATIYIREVAAPIGFQKPTLNETVKAAVRPVRGPRDVPVLHRVEMDVVDVALEVSVVANGVFPIASLPDALFTLRNLAP